MRERVYILQRVDDIVKVRVAEVVTKTSNITLLILPNGTETRRASSHVWTDLAPAKKAAKELQEHINRRKNG